MLRIVIWYLFWGDLSESEKLSEIKPPLGEHCTVGILTSICRIIFLKKHVTCIKMYLVFSAMLFIKAII